MSDAVDDYRAWIKDVEGWMPAWVRTKADAAIAELEATIERLEKFEDVVRQAHH